ncbi:ammonia channel protein, partial [Achromobacter xylosoxidans]
GPVGALVIGVIAGIVCVWGVNGLKRLLRADDALDVFGVHGVGGIVGALLTGVFNAQILGGPGLAEPGMIGHQLWVQLEGVLLTIVWSGVVAWIAYKIANALCGMRVPEDQEREGLDVTSHGESAYHS